MSNVQPQAIEIDPHDIDFTPHHSSDAKDFFQSDRDIAIQKARDDKRARLTASPLGSPIKVASKVLALVVQGGSATVSDNLADLSLDSSNSGLTDRNFIYTAESGHVARRVSAKVLLSPFTVSPNINLFLLDW
jgi:hypothetical protein